MQTHKIFQVMTPDAMQHGTKTRYDHDHFKCNQTVQHAHNPPMSQKPKYKKEKTWDVGEINVHFLIFQCQIYLTDEQVDAIFPLDQDVTVPW